MSFIERIKTDGINRLEFFGFLIVWVMVGTFIKILFNAASAQNNSGVNVIAITLLFVHYSILAYAVYCRLKNANVKHSLAIFCCFVPFLQLAPIIACLWYKPEGSIGNFEYLKEKYDVLKNSGLPSLVGAGSILILLGVGYIYNIVWFIDRWHHLSVFSKMLNIASVFLPPIGGVFGLYHFF